MTKTAKGGVIRVLANRRMYQACSRVLDGVDSALAATRSRTGVQCDVPAIPASSDQQAAAAGYGEFDAAVRTATAAAAYQMSRRTTAAIRQRSLTDFLR